MAKQVETVGLSAAQMEIMNAVWDRPRGASVAEVWKTLSAKRKLARNTVQTMLVRLEDKGWLSHREEGAGFRYVARRPRQATLRRMVGKLVETAFAGSADGLVMALLQGRGVTKEEAERIRTMIDEAERGRA
ncbi:MAG TPA: BlaI/MecI/CopY family transcriptional regulator [Pirellulales bacterium]|jgi:BlaI family penicillinase repressor|nr:BlaI/MecI/CopY family transcriptional regulator [Pirellulales bacterium]